jgi:FlaA1/EpsC-like NDP-sugar epimerase
LTALFRQAFKPRRLLVFCLDVVLIAVSLCSAFLLRFDFSIPPEFLPLFKSALMVALIVKPLVFLTSGLYRSIWKYASLQDGIEILKVVTVSSALSSFLLLYLQHFSIYPRSVFILDWFLLLGLITASRLIWRVFREIVVLPRLQQPGSPTLIVGAGEAGSLLLRDIRRQEYPVFKVIGFVSDNVSKNGMKLDGVAVLGTKQQLPELITQYQIQEVIIAIPSVRSVEVREIVKICEHCRVNFKILPAISDIIEGRLSVSQIKEVAAEDLLGRDEVSLDKDGIRSYLAGKRVLVTGAAGSIGSEICRQVARFEPAKLILLDSAETPLFEIELELAADFPDLRLVPYLADIRQRCRLDFLFETFQPEVVFHAAAYKHVPMMEYNPVEAVSNNVAGTRLLAETAQRFGVTQFVMISTDKAVNPTNIMGASKRAAERFVQALACQSTTKFTTVRFGNVLGSSGSAIPRFMEQIKAGGPVTVTHPEVIRYFMTVAEATQLVLQASCLGSGGEIFLLDMGEPVKIADLAEELIRLAGFTPHEEIKII